MRRPTYYLIEEYRKEYFNIGDYKDHDVRCFLSKRNLVRAIQKGPRYGGKLIVAKGIKLDGLVKF